MAQCCVGIGVGEHRHTSLEKRRETGGSCSCVSHRKLYESRVPYCGKIYTHARAYGNYAREGLLYTVTADEIAKDRAPFCMRSLPASTSEFRKDYGSNKDSTPIFIVSDKSVRLLLLLRIF